MGEPDTKKTTEGFLKFGDDEIEKTKFDRFKDAIDVINVDIEILLVSDAKDFIGH